MGCFSLLSLLFFLLPFSSFQTSSNVSSSSIIHHPSPLCHPYERSALIQFKNSFSVNNTIASSYYDNCDGIDPPTISWAKNDASNCCAWRGVTCDEKAGHVIGLDLSCARLQGAFHSNSTLFFLRNLQSLYLSLNDFGGSTIPSEFGKFTNLEHLILRDSNFSGNVPPEISYLSKLVTLDLSWNNFHKLNVDTFTLKRIVTNLTNLEALSMVLVDMSSVSPVVLMNLSSSLINLTLGFCSLGWNFPADYIFHLPKLEMLSLGGNENLTGSLFPKSNRNTSSPLKRLNLFDTKLSIDFPFLIQNFKYSLEYLALGSCKILGWNPTLLANLTQIIVLFLPSNNLGGEIRWSSLMHLERLTRLELMVIFDAS
nr:receptor-like protein Cf-9 homolog [Ziziphus jujuba var. spinosa]